MRANVRPFVREYKSRSRESAIHPLKNWVASDEGLKHSIVSAMIAACSLIEFRKRLRPFFAGRRFFLSASDDE